ncbi:FAD-binding protein [Arthrobacter sp. RIT-PI-e]|uniref:FAD-binding protein n=1 Tax=Arthrobacter sp. RIT-PI-e TaxID=1681197 RepID=UPI000675F975|nr:FAD-binding protein [Arthrobacter sp. RIT-PI-e]KNC15065.1 FAD-binding protein [Arthrobacter sp. RIT-PI-e]
MLEEQVRDTLNWAGNYEYRARTIEHPTTLGELQRAVASAGHVKALGSRHSFNDIADSPGTLVSLDLMDPDVVIDEAGLTVTVGAGVRYGVLAEQLQRRGFAIHNLASLPHISVGGAIATATHGSGNGNGNLSTAVVGLEIVTASGDVVTATHGSGDFDGMVVGLGALGITSRVTLRVEPTFEVRQNVFTGIPWDAVLADYDAATSSAYSVSLFTDWSGDSIGQAWLKSRTDAAPVPTDFFGGRAADRALHPVPGVAADHCTQQLGEPGPWSDRLAHFRLAFTPSNGEELQTEYLVGREHAVEAINRMRALAPRISPLLQVSEVRSMAADELWLSNNYRRDGIGLHFTWKPLQPEVEALLPELEAALAPLGARPHWGKLFAADAAGLAPLYPRFDDFRALAQRMDPEGKFRNAFLDRTVFGV